MLSDHSFHRIFKRAVNLEAVGTSLICREELANSLVEGTGCIFCCVILLLQLIAGRNHEMRVIQILRKMVHRRCSLKCPRHRPRILVQWGSARTVNATYHGEVVDRMVGEEKVRTLNDLLNIMTDDFIYIKA
jgi:hypothetical protein